MLGISEDSAGGPLYFVHFDGWHHVHDEWVGVDRMAPIHTHTPRGARSTGPNSGVLAHPEMGTKVEYKIGNMGNGTPFYTPARVQTCSGKGENATVLLEMTADCFNPSDNKRIVARGSNVYAALG